MIEPPYYRTVEIWVPQGNFAVGMSRKIKFDGQPTNINYLAPDKMGVGGLIWRIIKHRYERIDNIRGMWFYIQETGQSMLDRDYQNEPPSYAVEEEMPHSLFQRSKAQGADATRKLTVSVPNIRFHVGALERLKDGTKIYWCDDGEHLVMNEQETWHIRSVSRANGVVTFVCDNIVKA